MFKAFTAALILLCSSFAVAQQWTEVRSSHYTVTTDGSAQQARDLAERFEQVRAAFAVAAETNNVHLPVPLDIVAFRSSQEYQAYAPRSLGGTFEIGDDRSYALLDLSSPDKWQPVFSEYVRQLVNGTLPPDSKLDPQQLGTQLASAPKQSTAVDASKFAVRTLDATTVRVRLAALRLAAQESSDKTVQEFTAMVNSAPNDAAAHRELGYLYFLRGEFDSAAEHLGRALALDPKDPWANYYEGLLTVRRSLAVHRPPEDVAKLKQNLQIATTIPDMADAYSLLSFADQVQNDNDAAVADAQKAVDGSPRSETYALNLARAYLSDDQPVPARDILRRLKDSKNHDMAFAAEQNLARAENAANNQATTARHKIPQTYDLPKWHRSETEIESEPEKPAEKPADTRPVKYLQGELLRVDCSTSPAATLSIKSGARTLKMVTPDSKKLLLIGADEFSCSWRNKRVVVNYKAGGKADGDLVSLEVQ